MPIEQFGRITYLINILHRKEKQQRKATVGSRGWSQIEMVMSQNKSCNIIYMNNSKNQEITTRNCNFLTLFLISSWYTYHECCLVRIWENADCPVTQTILQVLLPTCQLCSLVNIILLFLFTVSFIFKVERVKYLPLRVISAVISMRGSDNKKYLLIIGYTILQSTIFSALYFILNTMIFYC